MTGNPPLSLMSWGLGKLCRSSLETFFPKRLTRTSRNGLYLLVYVMRVSVVRLIQRDARMSIHRWAKTGLDFAMMRLTHDRLLLD